MTISFSKKLALAGMIGLMGIMSTVSDADAWGGRRRGHGYGHGGGGYGPGIALGVLGGLAVGAAIASQPRYAPAPYGYYSAPQQPVYYDEPAYVQPRPHRYRCLITRYDHDGYPYQKRAWCRG
jgi:hypothetical protein